MSFGCYRKSGHAKLVQKSQRCRQAILLVMRKTIADQHSYGRRSRIRPANLFIRSNNYASHYTHDSYQPHISYSMESENLTSFLGWIDFTEEDQKRARDYLRSLSEGTLDELGFGIIRDAFADRFFPATSTAMTRAKYFVLVPAIYIHVMKKAMQGEKARKACYRLEQQLRKVLIDNGEIAARQELVKNYPAAAYWAALKRLEIYLLEGSPGRYFNDLTAWYEMQQTSVDDDNNAHAHDDSYDLWDPEFIQLYDTQQIPIPNPEFAADTKLKVTLVEADYLRRRFKSDPSKSLIAHAFSFSKFDRAGYPWEWKSPPTLQREIVHAEQFSMLVKIATLTYYNMLIQMQLTHGAAGIELDLESSIELWWDNALDKHRSWNLDDFVDWIRESRSIREDDEIFIRQFHRELCTVNTAKALVDSAKVRGLIKERERIKRPNKCRLKPGRFLNEWKPANFGDAYYSDPYHVRYHLDFRSRIASTIVHDIFEGLTK